MAFSLPDQMSPTKLGFKNPQCLDTNDVTNKQPRGFRTDRGINGFSGI